MTMGQLGWTNNSEIIAFSKSVVSFLHFRARRLAKEGLVSTASDGSSESSANPDNCCSTAEEKKQSAIVDAESQLAASVRCQV